MRRPALAAILFALSTAACHSWRPQATPTPQSIEQMNGRSTVRILRRDRSLLVLAGPRVAGDSIVGTAGTPPQRAAVAMADVERIETRKVSAGKTAGLVAGIYGVAALVVVLAAVAGAFGGFVDC